MAIGRLSMKVGKAGKAFPHAAYIARKGQYADRLEHGEKLEATEAGNMPAWAHSNPLAFWQAADAYERKNGTTYREMEIALPRELDAGQRSALVREFVRQEIGERHAYQWAIHRLTAADGGEQPHVHLMFSERQRDSIERDPEQYFKRYNAKVPEKGGARKGYGARAGQTLTKAVRAAELKELRGRWEAMCNQHLEQAGQLERIDMRSHAERGTGLEPEAKQLPSQWRGTGRGHVIEFRQARRELAEARAEVVSIETERQRIERMSAAELAAEINRLRPPPVHTLVERDPGVIAADQERLALQERHWQTQTREVMAAMEAEQWRQAHPLRGKAHDAGVWRSAYLAARAQLEAEARQERLTVAPRIEEASLKGRQARSDAEARITSEQAPARERVAELERIQAQKRERAALERDFKGMAAKRAMKAHGWADTGRQWQATPPLLRVIIDEYNRRPKDQQERALSAWMRDLEKSKAIAILIERRREHIRENDRGRSR